VFVTVHGMTSGAQPTSRAASLSVPRKQPPKPSKPRRKPSQAETDYARWAMKQLDDAAFERAARDKT
jgi:hypothetical protein